MADRAGNLLNQSEAVLTRASSVTISTQMHARTPWKGDFGMDVIPRGIISADGHVCEPPNCYIDYIEPKYRDNAPRVLEQPDGTEAFVVPGMKRPFQLGFIDGAGFTIKDRNERARKLKFSDVREGAY